MTTLKKLYARYIFCCSAMLFALAIFAATANAQEFKAVHDGVEYAEVVRTIDGQPVRINLLRLDLKKVRIDAVHSGSGVIGTGKTSSIAAAHNAVAAINAGFFRLDTSPFAGEPAGVLQIDGKLLSESNNGRIALEITNDDKFCQTCLPPVNTTVVSIDHLNTYAEFWSGRYRYNITGIDRDLKDNEAVLYTPEFGLKTTPSDLKPLVIVIQNKKIVSVSDSGASVAIPRNGSVLLTTGSKRVEVEVMAKKGNDALTILGSYASRDQTSASNAKMKFIDVEDIVGGVPQLIKNGRIDVTWEKERSSRSFFETRHPRTAVAILKDGKFLMVTVDGRSESSGGIGLYDLASYLLELGAVDAMNLDGGGSTTMYLDGKVVNHPSDKEGERQVSDALLVTLRRSTPPQKR